MTVTSKKSVKKIANPHTEVLSLLDELQKRGVESFHLEGQFNVKFAPRPPAAMNFSSLADDIDSNMDLAKQELQNAVERFKTVNKESEDDLLWSV